MTYFITGTDTGAGKTWATVGMMSALKQRGLTVAGMKPVASGGRLEEGVVLNQDAEAILQHCSVEFPYELVNPYSFLPPIAPHLAARESGVMIDLEKILCAFNHLAARAGAVIVEGVGGWRVPLGETLQTADLVRTLHAPVILVVGMRLGCINHACLTAESIINDGLELCGWIANGIERDWRDTAGARETLMDLIPAPLLGVIPPLARFDGDEIASCLHLERLLAG